MLDVERIAGAMLQFKPTKALNSLYSLFGLKKVAMLAEALDE